MIKLIVFDLDGTLLTSKKTIAESSFKIIQKCQKAGIQICLCSGRGIHGILPIAKQLNMLDQGYICSMNGAVIHHMKSKEEIRCRPFSAEEMKAIIAAGKHFNTHITFAEGGISYWYFPWLHRFFPKKFIFLSKKAADPPAKLFSIYDQTSEIPYEFRKAIFCSKPKKLHQIQTYLQKEKSLSAFFAGAAIMDIVPFGVSKGHAVQKIMEQLQLTPEEVLCFGDSQNDVSMFEAVTHSIAMGNAIDELKEKALAVTDTNDRNGIAKMIEQYVQNHLIDLTI